MNEGKVDRKALEQRQQEILNQLNRVNEELQVELDRNEEEQAIQIEQDEVSISMEDGLRRELADIEEKLTSVVEDLQMLLESK
jgi:hypothetical protein